MKEPSIVMIVSKGDDRIALTFDKTEVDFFLFKLDWYSSHDFHCDVYIEQDGSLVFEPELCKYESPENL